MANPKTSSVISQRSHLSLVQSNAADKPRQPSKTRTRQPAIPRQITQVLKQLAAGEIQRVILIALTKNPEKIVQVSAGDVPSIMRGMSEPYLARTKGETVGNVTALKLQPTPMDDMRAIGMDYIRGEITQINMVIGYPDGTVKSKNMKKKDKEN